MPHNFSKEYPVIAAAEFEKAALLGGTNTGKTSFFREYIEPTITGPLLVCDLQKHPRWNDLKPMDINWIKYFHSGKRRVVLMPDEIDSLLNALTEKNPHTKDFYLNNCSILFEDSKNFLNYGDQQDKIDPRITTLCRMAKQNRVRLFFMFHSWLQTYTQLFDFLDRIVLFRVNDSIDNRLRRLNYDKTAARAMDERIKLKYRETNGAFVKPGVYCTYNEIMELS